MFSIWQNVQKRVSPPKCEVLTFKPNLLLKNLNKNSRNLFGSEFKHQREFTDSISDASGIGSVIKLKNVTEELSFSAFQAELNAFESIFLQCREPFLKVPKKELIELVVRGGHGFSTPPKFKVFLFSSLYTDKAARRRKKHDSVRLQKKCWFK